MTNIDLLNQLRPSYLNSFGKMTIAPERQAEVIERCKTILENFAQYEAVEKATGVHWKFIAIVHSLECDSSFKLHLHNGDPLTARTVNVPSGRPLTGNPPFTWYESACDALHQMNLSGANDWTLEGTLFHLELFNGMGYHKEGINSPYLWAGSNQYTAGKFVEDHKFDPKAVSKQIGAALLLKTLMQP